MFWKRGGGAQKQACHQAHAEVPTEGISLDEERDELRRM